MITEMEAMLISIRITRIARRRNDEILTVE